MSEMKRQYEYYYERFLQGVLKTRDVNFESKKDIRRNNRGVDQYRDAAMCISQYFPERVSDFALLLDNDQQDIRVACAVSILSFMKAERITSEKAVGIIRDLATNGTPLERTAWTRWLKDRGL